MKKIILLVQICLLAFVANSNAQATQLRVINNTGCDVFYTLLGDNVGSCNPILPSAFIVLPPGGVASYNASVIPTLSSGDWINGAYVYTSMSWCPRFSSFKIGEPCTLWPNLANYYLYDMTTDCNICEEVLRSAKWTTGGPGGVAALVFN